MISGTIIFSLPRSTERRLGRQPARFGGRLLDGSAAGQLAGQGSGAVDQGRLVAGVILIGILARRDQAEGGDAMRLFVEDGSGKAMGEAVGDAVEGEEALLARTAHLLQEGGLAEG